MANVNNLGCTTFLRSWTKSAVDCYKIGCRCSKCKCVPEDIKQRCQLKPVVLELVRVLGKPDIIPQFFEGLTEGENRVVRAILEGLKTEEEISKALNLTRSTVKSRIGKLYTIAIEQGCTFKRDYGRLKELCKFLKSTCSLEKERIDQWILQN